MAAVLMTNRLRCLRVRPPPSSTLLYLSWQESPCLALCLLCSPSLPCSLSALLALLDPCISSLASVLLVPSLFYAPPLLLAHFSASLPYYMTALPYACLNCSVSLTSSVSLPLLFAPFLASIICFASFPYFFLSTVAFLLPFCL